MLQIFVRIKEPDLENSTSKQWSLNADFKQTCKSLSCAFSSGAQGPSSERRRAERKKIEKKLGAWRAMNF